MTSARRNPTQMPTHTAAAAVTKPEGELSTYEKMKDKILLALIAALVAFVLYDNADLKRRVSNQDDAINVMRTGVASRLGDLTERTARLETSQTGWQTMANQRLDRLEQKIDLLISGKR